jgi:hypothetical protein
VLPDLLIFFEMTYMEEKKNCFYLSPPHLLTYYFSGLHYYRLPVPSLSLPVVFRDRVFCSSLCKAKYFGNNGVGNMRIISPLITEQLRAFVQDFFARTKIPVFITRFGSGSKFGTIFLLIMVFTLMILKYFHFTWTTQ